MYKELLIYLPPRKTISKPADILKKHDHSSNFKKRKLLSQILAWRKQSNAQQMKSTKYRSNKQIEVCILNNQCLIKTILGTFQNINFFFSIQEKQINKHRYSIKTWPQFKFQKTKAALSNSLWKKTEQCTTKEKRHWEKKKESSRFRASLVILWPCSLVLRHRRWVKKNGMHKKRKFWNK